MVILSSLVEVFGLFAVVTGAALYDLRAGLIVLGLVLLLVGWALDRGATR